jgi:hypothetical protein
VTQDNAIPPDVDPSIPTIARVYDYWLGGTVNFAVDRELAEKFVQAGRPVLRRPRPVDPGVVPTTQWRPDPSADTRPLPGWVGVARKR